MFTILLTSLIFGFTVPEDSGAAEAQAATENVEPALDSRYAREFRLERAAHNERTRVPLVLRENEEMNICVKNNVFIMKRPHTPQIEEQIYIYPIHKSKGDFVYSVSIFKNVSDEIVPHVSGTWVGLIREKTYSLDTKYIGEVGFTDTSGSSGPYPLPLEPRRSRLNWFRVLHETEFNELYRENKQNSEKTYEFLQSDVNLVYPQWVSTDFRLKLMRPFYGDISSGPANIYEQRNPLENERIEKWYNYPRQDESPFVPVQVLEDRILGDTAWDADENGLAPCTTRDEIQLTRLFLEYFNAVDELSAKTKLAEIQTVLESRPFPQKIAMTYRLFRMDPQITDALDGREASESAPSYPSERWKTRAQTLLALLREIRENALKGCGSST